MTIVSPKNNPQAIYRTRLVNLRFKAFPLVSLREGIYSLKTSRPFVEPGKVENTEANKYQWEYEYPLFGG